ncbi:cytochrome c family protein [Aestuariivirga sp.]|uniref:c-type cytochrome n=1 Tax=Aestuariivirga sp. TaxID=2650926 RepID=UPI0025C5B2B2|nr:cytochrome c family protein [Aestuariivirga sp.]MCA3554966.1 cytochrome c family protein [Aestuariivirga sp.]
MTRLTIALFSLLALPAAALAQQAGDAAKGEKVFAQCKACHEAEKGVNKVGPTLKGMIGRNVASVPDYKYSTAMLDYAKTHPVWTDELFLTYIENPKKEVPGTKMAFAGVKKPDDRANLLAYLKTKN